MDNKNQHDELDGLPSKSSKNALPPLWGDIAGALDASDAVENVEETNAKDAAQVAGFASIKAGFIAMFGVQEPPKFLWDTIEQDLEAQLQTDSSTEFSSIKNSFLAAFGEQQPPQSLWQELSERVDESIEETPKEAPVNYSYIKSSFERKYSAIVVPLFSWDDLVERMESEAALADTPNRFSCIKESFECVYGGKIPSAVTEKALWEGLYPMVAWWATSQRVGQALWSKRSAAVAVLLLISMGTWFWTQEVMSNSQSENVLAEGGMLGATKRGEYNWSKTRTAKLKKTIISKVDLIDKHKSTVSPTKTVEPITANKSFDSGLTNLKEENKTATPHKTTLNNKVVIDNNSTKKETVPTPVQPTIEDNRAIIIPESTIKDKEQFGAELQAARATKDFNLIINKPIEKLTEATTPHRFNQHNILNSLESTGLNATMPHATEFTISLIDQEENTYGNNYIPDPAITCLQQEYFREVRSMVLGKKMHFELGLEGRVGASFLLGKQLTEGGEKKITLCPIGAIGVNFQYYLSMNDAIVAGTYPYSTTVQCWDKKAGNSAQEEIVMNLSFIDFTFGYQRILLCYSSFSESPSSIYARVNLGVGWLTKSDIRISQRPISTSDLHENFNWNAGLALGNLHQIQHFVLDYGLTGNVGLNNFVTGMQPDVLQSARIVNIGAYVGFRYLFAPRKAANKKQRQFDWSTPFYIEEPQF